MNPSQAPAFLRRYTDLPALLHLLSSRQITLLDPKTWDDRNDAYFMSVFKERKALKTVLALCFSQSPETYHHWRVFSSGPAGICIVFDRPALLDDLRREPLVSVGSMTYLTMTEARKSVFEVDRLPFIKRYSYKPENEFRALYTSTTEALPALDIPVRLSSIRSISLSPWMNGALSRSVTRAIRAVDGCSRLKVSRSTLVSNEQWKRYADRAV